ncbi:MAG: hypothetical protein H7837_06235 [Magnetococcus sp. MYC-9]
MTMRLPWLGWLRLCAGLVHRGWVLLSGLGIGLPAVAMWSLRLGGLRLYIGLVHRGWALLSGLGMGLPAMATRRCWSGRVQLCIGFVHRGGVLLSGLGVSVRGRSFGLCMRWSSMMPPPLDNLTMQPTVTVVADMVERMTMPEGILWRVVHVPVTAHHAPAPGVNPPAIHMGDVHKTIFGMIAFVVGGVVSFQIDHRFRVVGRHDDRGWSRDHV